MFRVESSFILSVSRLSRLYDLLLCYFLFMGFGVEGSRVCYQLRLFLGLWQVHATRGRGSILQPGLQVLGAAPETFRTAQKFCFVTKPDHGTHCTEYRAKLDKEHLLIQAQAPGVL